MQRNEPSRGDDWRVSKYNFDPGVHAGTHLPESVEVVDLTLREGRQVSGTALSMPELLEYARRVADAGFRTVEMHHYDPDEIRQVKGLDLGLQVQSLVHPTESLNPDKCRMEIDHSLEVGADILCLSAVVSDYNYQLVKEMGGLDISREAAIDAICESVTYGKDQGAVVSVLLADFSRLDIERLIAIAGQLADAGADIIRLDDICAPCNPAVYRHHAWAVKQVIKDARLAIHTHDDFGLALAGQLAAMEGGADILEGCVNGLGERAGIPNIAALVATLEVLYGYNTGIRLSAMQDLSDFVRDVWKQPVPERYAVVGRNAFSHTVGVHYVNTEWAFHAWNPDVVGNNAYVPLSMFSGPLAVRRKARDLELGNLSDDQAEAVFQLVRQELSMRKAVLEDKLFIRLVEQVASPSGG